MREYLYETKLFNYSLPFLLSVTLSVLIYKLVRKKFPYKVNCWFCNGNTKVYYNELNGFICPSCKQYNGFNNDGGYNKIIPEQHNEVLSSKGSAKGCNNASPSNGLCRICNNNQQLKVYQLAHFVPMNEDNYDIEIEHFQKQLDKAYKLCPKCDTFLKKTISKQNSWMIGLKVSYLRKKSLGLLNLNNTENSSGSTSFFKSILKVVIFFTVASFLLYIGVYTFNIVPPIKINNKIIKYIFNIYSYLKTIHLVDGISTENAIMAVHRNLLTSPLLTTSIIILISLVCFQSYLLYKKELKIQDSLNTSQKSSVSCNSISANENSFLQSPMNSTDISTDTIESDYESFNKSISKRKKRTKKNTVFNKSTPIFGESALFENSLNNFKSPISFRELNTYLSPSSVHADKPTVFQSKCDLNVNLENLNLSSNVLKQKPILSPPKFRNPWTGGFWNSSKIDVFSRSSSQSSGFYSNVPENNYNSLPNSRSNSVCGELDCGSVLSEPILQFKSNQCSFIPVNPGEYYSHNFDRDNNFQNMKQPNSSVNFKSLDILNLNNSVCSGISLYSPSQCSNKKFEVSSLFSSKSERL